MRVQANPGARRATPTRGDDLQRQGDKISTGRYEITVGRNAVRVFDKESRTWVRAFDDPHLRTSDGDKAQFHDDNLTIDLQDGTKITIVPTAKDANGAAWIDRVAVMKGDEAIVARGVHDAAGPKFGRLRAAAEVDARFADGTVLRAGEQVDDLFFAAGGEELIGADPAQKWMEHLLDGRGGVSLQDFAQQVAKGGGDVYSRLFAILSRIDNQLEGKVGDLEKLQGMKEELDKRRKAHEKSGSKQPFDVPKGYENIDGRIQTLTFEVQRLQGFKSQAGQMMTQLMQNDHQTKMSILRNIRS